MGRALIEVISKEETRELTAGECSFEPGAEQQIFQAS